MNEKPARPAREFRTGSVKCAVWENDTQRGTMQTFSFQRLYKKEGEKGWKTSDSYRRRDLPLLLIVSVRALLWSYQHDEDDNGSDES